ncbi:MAG: hypothetical protein LBJ73_01875 [Rickettsiales bacterium]|jgi:hypothetical protein|nr:hypothetical protein [Rickettsiales bacterium]
MKKSTIVLALLVCAFTVQGAFADVVATGSDSIGSYEIGGASNTTPETDYEKGIYTIYNTGAQYLSYSTYKGHDVPFSDYSPPDYLEGYLIQGLCASKKGTASQTDCSVTTIYQNNVLYSDEIYCWCRLKRISDNLAYNGWVYYNSNLSAANCTILCIPGCRNLASLTGGTPAFREALIAPFELYPY